MNLERLQSSLRRARDARSVEVGVDQGLIPARVVQDLEASGERVSGEELVRRGLLSAADLDKLRRWADHPDRAELLLRRLPLETPPEVRARLRVPGALLGKYVLISPLGSGGMGAVHRAWDTGLSRWVALKTMTGPEESRKRFLLEAKTAAGLDHPGIVPVYEAGRIDGESYIAMKLIDGASLHGLRLTERDAAEAVRDAARAVEAAHQRGIVHRDLKPGNLLMDGSGRVYVGDFGIAREIRVDTRLTASGSVLGTPAYMAPEQARGEPVGPACDVYALGATLFELVRGVPPFQDANLYELMKKVVEGEAPPLGGNSDLALVVARCLEKDPARRYATARELADDLQRFLDGEAISAHAPGFGHRLRKVVARRPVLSLLILAAVIAAGATVALTIERRIRAGVLWEEARAHLDRKDYGRTMETLGRYLELRPAGEEARRLKAECERALEEQRREAGLKTSVAESAELLRRALDRTKEAKALWRVTTSRREQWEKLFDDAMEAADGAIARYPGLASGPYTRGEIFQARGRWAEAVAAFDAALALDAGLRDAWFRRGLCHLQLYSEAMNRTESRPAAEGHKARVVEDLKKYASLRGAREDRDLDVRYAGAVIALAENRPEEAERAATLLLEEVQSDERFWLLKANAQIHRRRPAEALRTLDVLIATVMPQYPDAFHLRGVARMQMKDPRGALGEFDRYLALDPKAACGWTDRGWAQGESGDYAGEIESCTKAITLDPRDPRPYRKRGWARGEMGDHRGKIEDCTRAIEIDPSDSTAYNYRAVAQLNLDDPVGALLDLNRAIDTDPKFEQALGNRSMALFKLGDIGGAIEEAGRVIALAPDDPKAWQSRGVMKAEARDLKGAAADYSKAIALQPGNALYPAERADLRRHLKDLIGAEEDLTRAIALEPRSVDYLIERAEVRWKLGNLRGGLEDTNRAVELEPGNPATYGARVTMRGQLNDLSKMIEDCTTILTLDPNNARAWLNRGAARGKRGDWAGARDDLSRCLELEPRRTDAWSMRGVARGNLGDWAGARSDCARAVELEPRNAKARTELGWVKGSRKDYQGEIEDCTLALRLDPDYAQAHENRAWAYQNSGNLDGELADRMKLVQLFPKQGARYVDRGRLYRKTGDWKSALADFRKAVELDPDLRKSVAPMIEECEKHVAGP